jgi:hypothetical protein
MDTYTEIVQTYIYICNKMNGICNKYNMRWNDIYNTMMYSMQLLILHIAWIQYDKYIYEHNQKHVWHKIQLCMYKNIYSYTCIAYFATLQYYTTIPTCTAVAPSTCFWIVKSLLESLDYVRVIKEY